MILSDITIARLIRTGHLGCTPWSIRQVQPASLEVHLDWTWAGNDRGEPTPAVPGESLTVAPGEFLLAHTVETLRVPHDLAAQLSGKSSLGRLGLLVHATAGWIDPGFTGQLVLELKNIGPEPVTLFWAQPVGQLVFHLLDREVGHPYGHEANRNHYQGQQGTQISYLRPEARDAYLPPLINDIP